MKVAVPLLQHSQWFGHLALSQTVCSLSSSSSERVREKVSDVGSVMRSHSGRRGLADAALAAGEVGAVKGTDAGDFESVKAMTGTRYTMAKELKGEDRPSLCVQKEQVCARKHSSQFVPCR